MTTVGQLTDIHHTILNVRTPPGDLARNRNNLFDNPQRTYRKDFDSKLNLKLFRIKNYIYQINKTHTLDRLLRFLNFACV